MAQRSHYLTRMDTLGNLKKKMKKTIAATGGVL